MATEEPVSRIWACVFSVTIFALLWTQKMQKTRLWLVVWGGSYLAAVGLIFPFSFFLDSILPASATELGYNLVGNMTTFVVIAIPVYFMLRWTTAYNTKMFGYSSKRAWKKNNTQRQEPQNQTQETEATRINEIVERLNQQLSRIETEIGVSLKDSEPLKDRNKRITQEIQNIKNEITTTKQRITHGNAYGERVEDPLNFSGSSELIKFDTRVNYIEQILAQERTGF